MSNYIFLDVDGVLNSSAYFDSLRANNKINDFIEINEFNVKMLAEIYHQCNAKIVLASTWKELDNKTSELPSRMYNYLEETLRKYDMEIFSKTPDVNGNRPAEIAEWLVCNGNKDDKFVILDDDYSIKDYTKVNLGGHIVKTKYFCNSLEEGGLQQEHVEMAIAILSE